MKIYTYNQSYIHLCEYNEKNLNYWYVYYDK